MAFSLPIPSSPSSASADSPNAPQTPMSPTYSAPTLALHSTDQSSAPSTTNSSPDPLSSTNPQAKRKPSRRANTAERRATHNAVERQRRETLNGRFLDLAALLPNLSQIRRPSKSAIVNSSIAYIHASRRHRAMASREVRLLKLEADALRRELNEWRDRANLPRVEEPVRSEAFSMVLSGEVEVLTSIPGMDEEEEGEGLGDNDDDVLVRAIPVNITRSIPEDPDDLNSVAASAVKPTTSHFPHNLTPHHPGAPHLTHIVPRPVFHSRPMIAQNISGVSFENPAMASLYDQQTHVPSHQYQMQFNAGTSLDTDKSVAWNSQIFATPQLEQQFLNQAGLFTPANIPHGSSPNSVGQQFAHQAYFHGHPQQHPTQHIYGSPVDSEDASSVSSGPGFGGRDSSSSDSTYGSPQDTRASSASSQSGSYEVPGILTSGGLPIRMNTGGTMWNHNEMDSIAALKPNINMASAPIAIGTGGGNGGFGMII
ncbi:hypothetical protein F5148DRAFT_985569 [Russula earlei]|uniref:Uncharacterized protein n=1 Tax=Russula earlei TaxID=71964 RepID=A0ACC0TYB9_9AGAM|nr:hypothetical protein F5148DRAFT_985569 [Russula earlei]